MWDESPSRRFVILDGQRMTEGDRNGETSVVAIERGDRHARVRHAEAFAPQRQRAEAHRHRQHHHVAGGDGGLGTAFGVADHGPQPVHAGRHQEGADVALAFQPAGVGAAEGLHLQPGVAGDRRAG